MRILSWDIEASNLAADFGIVLCVGFKEIGKGKATVYSLLDYTNGGDLIKAEKQLLKDVSTRLLDSEVWLTHFGTYYDIPFINTRLLYHNLPILPPSFPHVDTWKTARGKLKLRNNRLNTISEFFRTKDSKNAIKPEQWIRAMGGHEPSMAYIVEHCRRDVLVLEEVYLKLRCLVGDHPNLAVNREHCGVCQDGKLIKRGFHLTRTRKYQRYQCNGCGAWSKGSKPIETTPTAPLSVGGARPKPKFRRR